MKYHNVDPICIVLRVYDIGFKIAHRVQLLVGREPCNPIRYQKFIHLYLVTTLLQVR